jgi:uncharacterized membrane protein
MHRLRTGQKRRMGTTHRVLADEVARRPDDSGSLTAAGILLGLGLGGFVDGIVLHQVLQWHHMGTAHGDHASFPETTVSSLEDNTLWDGLFHGATWIISIVGLYMLWRALRDGHRTTWLTLTGLLLVGWGIFNVVEGLVNHQLLGIHHVRDDIGSPLSWDIGFLVFGAALIVVGSAMRRADLRPARHRLHVAE